LAAYLSPIGNEMQADANGAPLVAGKIYTYLAGTSTPAATYTSSAGVTQQSNPIILNSLGMTDSAVWLGAGVSMKLIVKDSADVTMRTIDNVLGINDPSGVTAQDQWVAYSGTATFIGTTSFSLAGDQTGVFQVNRRVKTSNAGGTVYSTIATSVFSAGVTTVTVTNDSGTLDAGLSAVSYGLLSVTSPSLPMSFANGTIATTQAVNDSTTKLATTAFANPARSLAGSGYVKLPSGLIIQWLTGTTNASAGTGSNHTFPLAFPTSCYVVQISPYTQTVGASTPYTISAISPTTTQFTSQASSSSLNFAAIAIGI
jgi:hypothetical protein